MAALLAATAVGLAGGCANQSPPPGGAEDRRPPIVVRTEPDTFGVMTERDGRVRFQFDERISENVAEGGLPAAVTVSPMTSQVHVSHGRTSLTVWLEDGFRPDLVYRVTVQPVVSDLFGNRMQRAFELVFSTGGTSPPTATLAGEAWDRLSGNGVNGATVLAVSPDSLVNVARADQNGLFAFRYLPVGDFVLTAFQDQDRNREVGPRESRGSLLASVSVGDTVLVDIPLLVPDTTPAAATLATALDSQTIVVQFDDYLDPDASADQIGLRLTREGGDAPIVTRLFHEPAYQRYVQEIEDSLARLDSIATAARLEAAAAAPPDSTAAAPAPDSTGGVGGTGGTGGAGAPQAAPPDSVAPRRGPPPLPGAGRQAPGASPGRTLPGRRIVGLLDGPLREGDYQIRVTSVVNINGVAGGGGDVTLRYAPPPPPDSAAASDGVVPPDSAAASDTLGVPR